MIDVIERARRYIAKCPPAISGQGGHDATFHVAAVLVWGFALAQREALMLIKDWNRNCVPQWSEAELVHKVLSAAGVSNKEPRGYLLRDEIRSAGRQLFISAPSLPKPRPFNPVAATEAFLEGFRCGEAELFEASLVRPNDDPLYDGALLVGALYAPGELVNFVTKYAVSVEKGGVLKARPRGRGITLKRDLLSARFRANGSVTDRGGAWLRMNPLDGNGVADVNVTAYRFALLESDKLPLELQLPLFARLPLPIAAIINSGGRSIHALVKIDAKDVDEYRGTVAHMFALLARFGVDGKNKNPSRMTRLPGARREIGGWGDGIQRLLYLNPDPTERSIF